MKIIRVCQQIVEQISNLVDELSQEQFTTPIQTLSGATLGQHIRHTIEFFQCLEQGMASGHVCYDKRKHDKLIETDTTCAKQVMVELLQSWKSFPEDKVLKLEVAYDPVSETGEIINSSLLRELIYTIEHAVHHMALIKIGVLEVAPKVKLPHGFGVAVSTVRYRQSVSH